jgi:divinyl protochlorophyllide a 8-vinyl-reductase
MRALEEVLDRAHMERVIYRARIPRHPPDAMIPEEWFERIIRETRRTLPESEAEAVLRAAGRRTAEYVAANRIPSPVRFALRRLPARLAVPLLVKAFEKHAWTFAGGGAFRAEDGYPGTLVLDGAPTCGVASGPSRSGGYYEAAFAGLLELAAPGIHVEEVACRATGSPACRFRLELRDPSAGDPPCASSSSTRTTTPAAPRSPATGHPPGSPI